MTLYPPSYPPSIISTAHSAINIAQISDLHLNASRIGQAPCYQRFLSVLQAAVDERPDLLILTGDLVNDGNSHAYDWLFEQLYQTNIPFACIAGNHDVTHEIGTGLPFAERLHLPITPDARLLDCHRIYFTQANWQLLLLDSTIAGNTPGTLSPSQLDWLDTTLANSQAPAMLALHHHPIAMHSKWMDAYQLDNAQQLLTVINKHPQLQAIICGHVHQAHDIRLPTTHPCRLLTCPSTDRQFTPFADEFSVDTLASGYRMIQLSNTPKLSSYIKRVQN